ncbi:MAG: UxaA family hydrolase [Pseudomonadota bacterium]
MNKIVVLNDRDNVATSLMELQSAMQIEVPVGAEQLAITVRDNIEFGHKVAIRPIPSGDEILKYGEVIGRASTDIEPGDWVHIHNIESVRARGDVQS